MRTLPVVFLLAACSGAPDGDPVDTGEVEVAPPTYCETLGLPERAWSEGPYGTAAGEVAADFTLQTLAGPWTLSDNWTGCDSYIFFNHAAGYPYADEFIASDARYLVEQSPPNAHYFFMSYDQGAELATLEIIKAEFDAELDFLDEDERASWEGRLHYVTDSAWEADWMGDMLQAWSVFTFAIDANQMVHEVGYLGDQYADFKAEYRALSFEARLFNFELVQQARLDAETDVTIVPVFDGTARSSDRVSVELPSAAEMAGFDTLELDLALGCGGSVEVLCGEWDYLVNAYLCDLPDPADPDAVPACNTELGRWVTAYSRGGRWVHDASPMLALLKDGGPREIRFGSSYTYLNRFELRLSNRGKGSTPTEPHYLFSGGGFNQDYNTSRLPVDVPIPATAKKVELYAVISGHGWGSEVENCAEFCNHEHEFSVNGSTFTKDHAEAGTREGCIDQIDVGAVPNQGGTWRTGRGGWCPGMEVTPFIVDVTDAVTPGQTASVEYRGLFEGGDYTPVPSNSGQGFGARIDMASWLVISE